MSYKHNYQRQAWVFVGEQRSPRAKQLGVTWDDLALCSKTLHDALKACGVDGCIEVVNLWDDAGVTDNDVCQWLRQRSAQGHTIIALGRKVQAALGARLIPHHAMVHPAARGRIRTKARYHAHVAEVMRKAGALLPMLPAKESA